VGAIQRRRRRLRHTQAAEPDVAERTPPAPPPEEPAPARSRARGKPEPPREKRAGGKPDQAAGKAERASGKPAPAADPAGPAGKAGDGDTRTRSRPEARRPSPYDLAELSGAFALTANVQDPEPGERADDRLEPETPEPEHRHDHDETVTERGLRGLVGGGSSQVSVAAALRARDAARPTAADVAAAETDLVIVRRGWVPREELPRPGRRPAG
jgi:hypothetical protein